jgi:sigma-B regulation protein RsbU (phosphoserine phosphatase)
MARVNAEMTELLFGMETYITACYLSFNFEDNTYQYVNAGHPPLLIKKHNEHVFRKFTLKGYFINVKSDSVYEMLRGTLDEGDQFFMYTDGVIEARKNANEMYGYERMQAILDKGATLSAQETVDLLFEDVVEYTADGVQEDDQAMLFVKIKSITSRAGKGE